MPQAERLYGIVIAVVAFSVLPTLARMLRVTMRMTSPEPWAVGVRLCDEPRGVHRLTVLNGSAADGSTVEELGEHVGDVWVSIGVRAKRLVPVSADTQLRAGDDVVILAGPELAEALSVLFH